MAKSKLFFQNPPSATQTPPFSKGDLLNRKDSYKVKYVLKQKVNTPYTNLIAIMHIYIHSDG